jgi:phosphotransferase system  glucose/maltose/N-acetylglucosamine-specific IIC component
MMLPVSVLPVAGILLGVGSFKDHALILQRLFLSSKDRQITRAAIESTLRKVATIRV